MATPFDALFENSGRKWNVDPGLLRTIADQESDFDPKATGPQTSSGRAGGMMQIVPRTAKKLGVNPYKPEEAVDGAARLISEALDRHGNVQDAVAEYYGGPNPKLWGPKTRKYRSEVMAKYQGAASPTQTDHGLSDDALWALAGGQSAPKGAVEIKTPFGSAQVTPAADLSDDEIWKMAGGASPAVKTSAPAIKAAQTTSQTLGFEKGAFAPIDNASHWLENAVTDTPVGDVMTRMGGVARDVLPKGLVKFIDNPEAYYADQKAKGVVPGKMGEFAGNVASTAWVPGGPLAQGAVGGALLSDKKDLAGVAGDTALGALTGRLVAGGSDAVQIGVKHLLSKVPKVPTVAELGAAKQALYKAAHASGFTFKPADIQALSDRVTAEFHDRAGAGPEAAAGMPIANMLTARLTKMAQSGGVTLEHLDRLRSDAYEMAVAKGGPDSVIGSYLRREIDKLMDSYNVPLIREARAANTVWEKARAVADRQASGELAAASANSGRNVVNAQRSKLRPTIDPMHSGQIANWTPDEEALVNRIVRGTGMGNFARESGNFFRSHVVTGGGAVLGGLLGLSHGAGGVGAGGVAAPALMQAVGHGFRKWAESATEKDIADLSRLIAAGGSKQAAKASAKAVPTAISEAAEKAIVRLRPALVAASVPALAAARKPEKSNAKPKK